MKIESLQYFIILAESSSISQAAEKLFLSQQQLNRIILSLENDMGVDLIRRTNKGISLTDDGKEFLKYAQTITSTYRNMRNYFSNPIRNRQPNTAVSGECNVFLAPSLSLYTNEILERMKVFAPRITLHLFEMAHHPDDYRYHQDGIYLWVPEETDPKPIGMNVNTLCNVNIYSVYNCQFPPEDDKLTANFSTVHTSHMEEYRLLSGSLDRILEGVLREHLVTAMPDYVIPHARLMTPNIGFHNRNEVMPLWYGTPASQTLNEADEVFLSFLRTFVESLQVQSRKLVHE